MPIFVGHSYSILRIKEGIKTQYGKSINLIVLRNLHGQTAPFYATNEDGNYVLTGRNEKVNEGKFSVDLMDFLRNFTSIHFVICQWNLQININLSRFIIYYVKKFFIIKYTY